MYFKEADQCCTVQIEPKHSVFTSRMQQKWFKIILLLIGHECHVQNSNPHSADQKHQSLSSTRLRKPQKRSTHIYRTQSTYQRKPSQIQWGRYNQHLYQLQMHWVHQTPRTLEHHTEHSGPWVGSALSIQCFLLSSLRWYFHNWLHLGIKKLHNEVLVTDERPAKMWYLISGVPCT